jgi:hypothetical protein
MTAPISVRLDDDVRKTLEQEARIRRLGLSAYLRQVASEEAKRVRRMRIRRQSEAVGTYVASSAEAREFYDDWGVARAGDL